MNKAALGQRQWRRGARKMGFLRRMAGILGFIHGEEGGDQADEEEINKRRAGTSASPSTAGFPGRKGFGVQVQVPVERSQLGPVIVACSAGEGGVQGFRWHGRRLRVDEDGDVAEEFLDEVPSDLSAASRDGSRSFPTFRVKHTTQPAIVRSQMFGADGMVRHGIEVKGRLQWV
ncbi:phospholipid hydroperoxide glutathione peroxidase isoform X2 [Wolffia australiana]